MSYMKIIKQFILRVNYRGKEPWTDKKLFDSKRSRAFFAWAKQIRGSPPDDKYFYTNLKINKPSSFLKGFTC